MARTRDAAGHKATARSNSPIQRVGALLLAPLAAVCWVVCLSGLVGALYGRVGAERRAANSESPSALQATALAVRLSPWIPRHHADYAWSFGARGEGDRMRAEMGRALALAPGHPYLWMEYAQLRSSQRRFDREFTFALARGMELAPNAEPMQFTAGRLGARYWSFGDFEQQSLWARGMAYALQRNPGQFLRVVIFDRRETPFCAHVGTELGLVDWCEVVTWMRPVCDQPERIYDRALLNGCNLLGMMPRKASP